ncbi:MAG: hypothetical protein ACE5E7_00510 [Anaerolineae bacterium]
MITSSDGWAIGNIGPDRVLLHWDGTAWTAVASPSDYDLNAVSMVSYKEGWAVGDGPILHYTLPIDLNNQIYLPTVLNP